MLLGQRLNHAHKMLIGHRLNPSERLMTGNRLNNTNISQQYVKDKNFNLDYKKKSILERKK